MNGKLHTFLIERAKRKLGNEFRHIKTGMVCKTNFFAWDCQVAKCFGGLHVSYGCWVVWSASKGWLAERIKPQSNNFLSDGEEYHTQRKSLRLA